MKKTIIRISCICIVLVMGLSALTSCGKIFDLFNKEPEESETVSDVIDTESETDGKETQTEDDETEADSETGKNDTQDTEEPVEDESEIESSVEESEEEEDTEDEEETEEEEKDERELYRPDRIDYNKADFVIAQSLNDKKQWVAPVDGKGADAINVALTNRNNLLQTYFNVNVVVKDYDNSDNASTTIRNEFEAAAMSGTAISDIAFAVSGQISKSLIINGFIEDVNTLSALNLDASYYDQRLREEYNIEGRLFCLEGDFGLHDELRTHVVGVNKTKYDAFGYNEQYGSLYEIVKEGDWTLDLMLQMAKNTSDYASMGSQMTTENNWGIISESGFVYAVFLGTGNKIIKTDKNGALSVAYSDPTSYAIIEDMFQDITNKVVLENPETLLADTTKLQGVNFGVVQGMFAQGKALFRTSTLVDFTKYADMDDAFGILPVPKYDEEQDNYYSWCSSQAHSPLFIPRNNVDLDRTATITEAMAYFSKYMVGNTQTVHDAFYQNMADAKLCLTINDREMLDLIFEQRTFDLDHVLNISNTCNTVAAAAKGSVTSLPASLATIQNTMTNPDPKTNPLDTFLESMRKNYDN